MAEVLSQDEIDQLLSPVKPGSVSSPAEFLKIFSVNILEALMKINKLWVDIVVEHQHYDEF